jgi:hypothetical protein
MARVWTSLPAITLAFYKNGDPAVSEPKRPAGLKRVGSRPKIRIEADFLAEIHRYADQQKLCGKRSCGDDFHAFGPAREAIGLLGQPFSVRFIDEPTRLDISQG